jgi:AraC-like DNA-binding protein
MDALPERLSVREMAAAGVSLWSLQKAFERAHRTTPVAHVQHVCLQAARRDLEQVAPGDTVFAIARRWGFTSPDGAFRHGYWATYGERPSETLKRARAPKRIAPPAADDHVDCLECGKKSRRLRRHLAAAHGLTPDAYRQRWGLQRNYPLVCAELSRQISARAGANDLAGKGAQARQPWKNADAVARRERINGNALPSVLLVSKAEELVLAALPVRLSERYLAERLGIGLRTLRRSFLGERGVTAYVALRRLRLQEAQRRIATQPDLTLKAAAQQCGFGHYARFRRDLEACAIRRSVLLQTSRSGAGSPPPEGCPACDRRTGSIAPVRGMIGRSRDARATPSSAVASGVRRPRFTSRSRPEQEDPRA